MGIVFSIFIIAAGGVLTRADGNGPSVNGMNPDSAGLVGRSDPPDWCNSLHRSHNGYGVSAS